MGIYFSSRVISSWFSKDYNYSTWHRLNVWQSQSVCLPFFPVVLRYPCWDLDCSASMSIHSRRCRYSSLCLRLFIARSMPFWLHPRGPPPQPPFSSWTSSHSRLRLEGKAYKRAARARESAARRDARTAWVRGPRGDKTLHHRIHFAHT